MATNTVPVPNPFHNPHPKNLFCTSAQNIDEHHALIQSPAWQRAVVTAQMQLVRDLCTGASSKLADPNYLQAAALAFARIQGMHDFVNIISNLAEIPAAPASRPNTGQLDDN